MDAVIERLDAVFSRSRRPAISLGMGLDVYVGYEIRKPEHNYRWHGLKRNVDPKRPLAILQYTLAGEGLFRAPDRTHPQRPGTIFAAVVPSDHEYLIPTNSREWSFVWLLTHHPYVVSRLRDLAPPAGPSLEAAPQGELITILLDLIVAHRQRTDDRFTREQRLFDLLIAFDRAVWSVQHPGDKREQLLRRVRAILEQNEVSRINVDVVAEEFDMTRSNFQRARELLLADDASAKQIARLTGFADANHLCKAFRRRFGFTPGAFRKQVKATSRA
jgi:AraC-like DNA-binding protein